MTNEEAARMIAKLKQSLAEYYGLNENGIRAFDMAISALEAQNCNSCSEKPSKGDESEMSCSSKCDLVSRQEAIEAINELHDKPNAWLDLAVDALEKLPSEEPQRMRAKWIVTTSMQEGQITWRDYKCSNCSHHRGKPMNFCEVCGARMER